MPDAFLQSANRGRMEMLLTEAKSRFAKVQTEEDLEKEMYRTFYPIHGAYSNMLEPIWPFSFSRERTYQIMLDIGQDLSDKGLITIAPAKDENASSEDVMATVFKYYSESPDVKRNLTDTAIWFVADQNNPSRVAAIAEEDIA